MGESQHIHSHLADRASPRRLAALAMLVFVVYGTLIPFDLRFDARTIEQSWRHAHTTPFRMPNGRRPSRTDLLGNLLLFGVLGFFLQGATDPRSRRPIAGLVGATAAASLLSVGIEGLQLLSPSRVTSVTDWIVNTLGAFGGGVGGLIYSRRISPWASRWAALAVRANPMLVWAVAAVGLQALVGVVPFDVSIDVSDLARSVRGAVWTPLRIPADTTPTAYWVGLLTAAWPWALTAFVAGLSCRRGPDGRTRPDRAAACGWLVSVAMCVFVECVQVALVSRVTDVTDVLVGLVGASIGSLACGYYAAAEPAEAAGRTRQARQAAWAGLAVSAAIFVVNAASPFAFDWSGAGGRLSWPSFVPLYAYYAKTTLQALQDFVDGIAALIPFGVLIGFLQSGANGSARTSLLAAGAAAAVLAVAGEVLQLGLNRTPDVTDVLTAVIGAVLGAWMWTRYESLVRHAGQRG